MMIMIRAKVSFLDVNSLSFNSRCMQRSSQIASWRLQVRAAVDSSTIILADQSNHYSELSGNRTAWLQDIIARWVSWSHGAISVGYWSGGETGKDEIAPTQNWQSVAASCWSQRQEPQHWQHNWAPEVLKETALQQLRDEGVPFEGFARKQGWQKNKYEKSTLNKTNYDNGS